MKIKLSMIPLLLLCFISTNTIAGPFTDKLSICLVNNTTADDKEKLIQWIYVAMSSHPIVKDLSDVSVEIGEKLNKNTANLFMDLLTVRCKDEAKQALMYEENIALRSSFSTLGKVAMQGIMSDPAVSKYMGGLDKNFDKKKLESILPKKPAAK